MSPQRAEARLAELTAAIPDPALCSAMLPAGGGRVRRWGAGARGERA